MLKFYLPSRNHPLCKKESGTSNMIEYFHGDSGNICAVEVFLQIQSGSEVSLL